MGAADHITADERTLRIAFAATQLFLENFWRRGGSQSQEIGMLLSSMELVDGMPLDPAQWSDFVNAWHDVEAEYPK
ncbi:MAG: hypothetical protein B7Y35_15435 [Sphingomonadales bacterium 28-64-96]|nr:MAG: hypothetical protein B7Y35_15435 [Sphingomonadales bacterium 28-64-96]